MNLFLLLGAFCVLVGLYLFRKRPKPRKKEYSFHLVTNYGNLCIYAPGALQDLSFLATVITPESRPVTEESLKKFFKHGGILTFACDGGVIVGAACVVYSYKYNDRSARIEHVSVSPQYEGRGIGKKLVEMLIVDVRMIGESKHIDLTTEPARRTANRLYERLGFKIRKTNSRRLILQPRA